MRSTDRVLVSALAVLSLFTVACSTRDGSSTDALPVIRAEGSRAREYHSLDELATGASALVVVRPTGRESSVPLPATEGGTLGSAPTPFVEMRVLMVLSGAVSGTIVDVVSPGIDERNGGQALAVGGPYLLFLAPAMYGPNRPVGGYAIVGGPAGAFGSRGLSGGFDRIDGESPSLPQSITLGTTHLPAVVRTEAELLAAGP